MNTVEYKGYTITPRYDGNRGRSSGWGATWVSADGKEGGETAITFLTSAEAAVDYAKREIDAMLKSINFQTYTFEELKPGDRLPDGSVYRGTRIDENGRIIVDLDVTGRGSGNATVTIGRPAPDPR